MSETIAHYPANAKKLLTKSVAVQVFGQIIMAISSVLILKIMTNSLGAKEYGIYSTIIAFVTTFTLFTELGLNSISNREMAKNPEKASEIIDQNMGLRLALSVIMIPVVYGLGLAIYPDATVQFRIGILIMSSFLLIDSVWSISAAYFGSKIRNDIPALIAIFQQCLFLLIVIMLCLMKADLIFYIVGYVSAVGICALIAFVLVRKHIPIRPRHNFKLWKRYIAMSLSFGIMSVINVVYLKIDTIMLSSILGTTASGIYSVAYSLINTFATLSAFIMTGLTPVMATASIAEFGNIVKKAFHILLTFGLLLVLVGFYIKNELIIVISNYDFISAAIPFSILTVATLFSYLYMVFSLACVARDKHHKILYISLFSLFVNVLLNIYLIPRHGIIGAACTTLISEFMALILVYRVYRLETKMRIDISVTIRPLFAFGIAFASGFLLKNVFEKMVPIMYIFIFSGMLTLVFFASLYALGGMPKDLENLVKKSWGMSKLWSLKLARHKIDD